MPEGPYESDAELVAGLGRGEPEAEVCYARRYGPVIEEMLQRFRIGAGDRDEIVVRVAQNVVRQAVEHPISDLGKYTVTAALNAGRDFLRLRGDSRQEDWRRIEQLESMGPRRARGGSTRTLGDHERLRELQSVAANRLAGRNRQGLRMIQKALAELTEADRRVLLLRAARFDDEEIACYLGDDKPLSRAAVRQRHSRALKRLGEAYRKVVRTQPEGVRRELEACGMLKLDS